MPIASPIDICSTKTRMTIQNDASACVASSISPSMSAMPTGSFAPDSPSRIVPVRPRISRSPSTENITAGSVGAIAAPRRPEVIQAEAERPVREHGDEAGGGERPEDASDAIGRAAARKRRQPIDEPPSKRITISATVATSRRSRSRGRATGRGRRRARRRRGTTRPTGSTSGRRASRRAGRPKAHPTTSRMVEAEARQVVHPVDAYNRAAREQNSLHIAHSRA